ncbi:TPA: 16S rRNA (guanine(966)-N(2))-methyltransferase RsmD [Candidatus Gastranaerophilales bacterium HUM_9]|nr:MAG TPA: 16S rRNA (guanine(966)-N(2))-methyltransferase RsmD [Candidatus Gastranaerophilales bacterium HUM_9]HBX35353.1 16S rRNA (guanine(966)-N(2))-methyltransferase RsmD [Cyanobacteria bacterium UBA11440]
MNITGGKYNGRKIQAPDEKITRPTLSKVRMSVFNVLYSLLGDFEGKIFLDMFGGSGVMGLEALSRGFKSVIVFEKNKQAADVIRKNYKALNEPLNLTLGDSIKLIKKITQAVDVIYIDPPYLDGIYQASLENLPEHKIIILEHVVDIDLTGFNVIKQKKYGDKYITFIEKI